MLDAFRRRLVPTLATLGALTALVQACDSHESARPVPCLPNPTLRCVTDEAVKAIEPATANDSKRLELSIGYEALGDIALAQRKLGDSGGLEQLVVLARTLSSIRKAHFERHTTLKMPDPMLAHILAVKGEISAAKDIFAELWRPQIAAQVTELSERRSPGWAASNNAHRLMSAGLGDEARLAVEETVKRLEPLLGNVGQADQAKYFLNMIYAYHVLGDAEGVRRYGARAAEQLQAWTGDAADRVSFALATADAMLSTGDIAGAAKLLAAAPGLVAAHELELRRHEFHRLMFRLHSAAKNSSALEEARVALRRSQVEAAKDDPEKAASPLLPDDFDAAIQSGDSGEAVAIAQRMAQLAPTITRETWRDYAYSSLAKMYATLGDEQAMDAAVSKVRDPRDDVVHPALYSDLCERLSENGHVEAALRCATRFDDKRISWEFRRLKAYARIAADMAGR